MGNGNVLHQLRFSKVTVAKFAMIKLGKRICNLDIQK